MEMLILFASLNVPCSDVTEFLVATILVTVLCNRILFLTVLRIRHFWVPRIRILRALTDPCESIFTRYILVSKIQFRQSC